MTKLGSMNHLRLTVSDIPRAERFYSVVLGFLGYRLVERSPPTPRRRRAATCSG